MEVAIVSLLSLFLSAVGLQYAAYRNRGMSKDTKKKFSDVYKKIDDLGKIKEDIASIKTSIDFIREDLSDGKRR